MEHIFNKFSEIHQSHIKLIKPLIDIQNKINYSMLNYNLGLTSDLVKIGKLFDNSVFKVFQENQQRLHELYKPILSNDLKIASDLLKIGKLFDNSAFKVFQENQQIFKNFININNFTIPTLETDKYFDYIDKIDISDISEIIVEDFTKKEKEELDNLIDSFSKSFTDNEFFKKLSIMEKNEIIKFLFKLIFVVIPGMLFYYSYFVEDKHILFVNRDNVRIRETPTAETNKNIIKKLNRNEYVIKIDNKDGWIKVKYNSEDGKELEGWIYKTMLSKID